mmetsp:Transcript_30217/g.39830  ORF Transcript_30217/g.39830 Transcript_30217/m.39830 type:complete len:511 (+) Transcript_30217:205-1737(+)
MSMKNGPFIKSSNLFLSLLILSTLCFDFIFSFQINLNTWRGHNHQIIKRNGLRSLNNISQRKRKSKPGVTFSSEDTAKGDDILRIEDGFPNNVETITLENEDQKFATDKLFHTHFGAGRLGLGLVAPAMEESQVPYCIVQRPKITWKKITAQGTGATVNIEVNSEPIIKAMEVALPDKEIEDLLGGQSLVCINTQEKLLELVSQSTSFSCALGGAMRKVVLPLMKELPVRPVEERPVLYACENDHAMVKKIARQLDGKVNVICCMVDRICTGRTIDADKIEVLAEPFKGSIVLLSPPPAHIKALPFAGSTVVVPKSDAEASFLYERKLFLVNGMHTTLAFLTLCLNQPSGSEPGDHPLLSFDTADEKSRQIIWAWAMVRCMMLIENHGMEVLASAYNTEDEVEIFDHLVDFARTTLQRFSTIEDKTSRVLGGGVANRWGTRLRPAYSFLEGKTIEGSNSVYERFLGHVGLNEQFTRTAVEELLSDSHRFCQKCIQETISELVDFYKPDKQ